MDDGSTQPASHPGIDGTEGEQNFLPGERNVPRECRIFTNRNLRMESIKAIGFDLDHTLALYDREPFEQLTFDMAVENLIHWKGYPPQIRGIRYDPDFIIRGLVVDKKLGNILKMDVHDYIGRACHGRRPLDREERRRHYRRSRINLRSDRYQSFDTFFSMPEGSLYAAMVDLKARDPHRGVLRDVPVSRLFDDVRACVDKVHRDGSLKSVIIRDLDRFFLQDENLRPTLLRFRALGKKLFLVTNSEHEYTEAVMTHLLTRAGRDWKTLFDLIIVESRKPGFFLNGSEPVPIAAPEAGRDVPFYFRGGNARAMEKFLGANGDEVLYFGDHTYGDILRSKKTVGWRTAMIVMELEHEIAVNKSQQYLTRELNDLVARGEDLGRDRDQITLLLAAMKELLEHAPGDSAVPPVWATGWMRRELEEFVRLPAGERHVRVARLESTREGLEFLTAQSIARVGWLNARISDAHNPYWGPLFREGNAISRFARQVKEFSCIYTSRVANFLNYPGNFYFLSKEERLPHEM